MKKTSRLAIIAAALLAVVPVTEAVVSDSASTSTTVLAASKKAKKTRKAKKAKRIKKTKKAKKTKKNKKAKKDNESSSKYLKYNHKGKKFTKIKGGWIMRDGAEWEGASGAWGNIESKILHDNFNMPDPTQSPEYKKAQDDFKKWSDGKIPMPKKYLKAYNEFRKSNNEKPLRGKIWCHLTFTSVPGYGPGFYDD